MRRRIFILVALILILFSGAAWTAPLPVDVVEYTFRGDLENIQSLNLGFYGSLDQVNELKLIASHDGEELKTEAYWRLAFFQQGTNKLKLNLGLNLNLKELRVAKGIGLAGEGIYLQQNRYYWDVNYFWDEGDKVLVYGLDLAFPLTRSSFLILGLGNSYEQEDQHLLNLGIKVDI